MRTVRTILAVLLALAITAPVPMLAQQQSRVAGVFVAANYNTWQATVVTGNAATGGGAVIVVSPATAMADGRVLSQFNVNAPVTINDAASETFTPTAVAFGTCPTDGSVSGGLGPCATLTGTIANSHGRGAQVKSGTAGLQEALNDATAIGGGEVIVDRGWSGTTANITSAAPFSNVSVTDKRNAAPVYYYAQPTTLTALATPATRSAAAGATQVIDGTAVGTFANAVLFVCVTYVDMLGGESPCSASFSYTPAGSLATNWASPAASTGAIGWRAYAGITGTSTQYQLPITASNCTLTTLESIFPACAIGSSAIFTTPLTTSSLAPGYVVNVYRPNTQSHTTFGYQASASVAAGAFQSNYGPFIATGNIASGQLGVLGTVPLPLGYLNQIGKSVKISGKIASTAVSTAVQGYQVSLGPTFTTGTPTVLCQFTNTVTLAAVAYGTSFECTLTTNAIGASGTIMPNGFAITQAAAGGATALSIAVDTGTAAITNKLDTQNTIYIVLTTGTAATNPAQLLDLHIVPMN